MKARARSRRPIGRNATLTTLNLSDSNIGPIGAEYLSAAIGRNSTLKSLRLDSNNIGAEGARSLAAALNNNATPAEAFSLLIK
jgi:hypothetical protein